MTARNIPRTNTVAEQTKEDNSLILYRLDRVEAAVNEVGSKVDKQDNIKRSDLKDFQETIVTRFLDMRSDLQKQIDDKAGSTELADLKRQFYAVTSLLSTVMIAIVVTYLTTRK